MSDFQCPFCNETGENSYWLIDHLEHCPTRWAQKPAAAPEPEDRHRKHVPGTPWTIVTLTWTQTTATEVPLDPSERKVTVQVTDVSFSDSSAGESGTLTITDAAGATVAPATPPTWVSDDNGVFITLVAAADGMSATAVPTVPPAAGTANVTVTATDSLGTVLTFLTAVTVTVGPESAVSVAWAPITPAAPPAS